jgi:hypothetical protein
VAQQVCFIIRWNRKRKDEMRWKRMSREEQQGGRRKENRRKRRRVIS